MASEVKICGIKRLADVQYVNELLPEYVGFVFAKSKRQVNLEEASGLINRLNNRIKTVGVFVNEDIDKVKLIANSLKLSVLQFHGSEGANYINEFGDYKVWKAVGIKTEKHLELDELTRINQQNIDIINNSLADGTLLDSEIKGAQGGTGVTFNWDIIKQLNINKKLILAGGLTCQNITEAIKYVEPEVVDVSSGVETEGVKDYNKIREFINKVRIIL